jgi:hypothetical protein
VEAFVDLVRTPVDIIHELGNQLHKQFVSKTNKKKLRSPKLKITFFAGKHFCFWKKTIFFSKI